MRNSNENPHDHPFSPFTLSLSPPQCARQTIVMSYEEVFSSPLPSLLELNALAAAADSALESMLLRAEQDAGTAAPHESTAGTGMIALMIVYCTVWYLRTWWQNTLARLLHMRALQVRE